jgi:hypothetical protein
LPTRPNSPHDEYPRVVQTHKTSGLRNQTLIYRYRRRRSGLEAECLAVFQLTAVLSVTDEGEPVRTNKAIAPYGADPKHTQD